MIMKGTKSVLASLLVCGGLMISATSALAGVVRFDDAYTSLGDGGNPSTYYLGSKGLTISGNYYGIVGGNGNGDPGNWNLQGTNGSAFFGCNSGNSCNQVFSFNTQLSQISVDIGVPGFNWAGTYTATVKEGLTAVATQSVTISSPADPGNWRTINFTGVGPFDSLSVTSNFTSGFAMGVDNIVYSSAIPEPASLALLGLGLFGLGFSRRKKA